MHLYVLLPLHGLDGARPAGRLREWGEHLWQDEQIPLSIIHPISV